MHPVTIGPGAPGPRRCRQTRATFRAAPRLPAMPARATGAGPRPRSGDRPQHSLTNAVRIEWDLVDAPAEGNDHSVGKREQLVEIARIDDDGGAHRPRLAK